MGKRSGGFHVEPLQTSHDRKSFQCGIESLDRYLKTQASQDFRRHAAMVFVLVDEIEHKVAGYYTLSATSIDAGELPAQMVRKLPRYGALPATLMGRLAVDRQYQSRGLGAVLLADALHRSYRNTQEIGSVAVVVDALDGNAAKFYQNFGFIPFPSQPLKLFMAMNTIASLESI